jgi:site-specific DNA-methyltransferase (adenine-specific)
VLSHEIENTEKHYALKVAGDSMIDEGIFNGDTVIIRKQEFADDGQTIVAIIDDNLATLKKIYREKNRIRLQPANPTLFPIYRNEVEIRGVVVKIVRNLEQTSLILPKISKEEAPFEKQDFELNKIYNIDCLEFMRGLKDNSIDLIFADPPYNLSKKSFKMRFSKTGGKDLNTDKGYWDKMEKDDFEKFTENWLRESFRILKKTGSIWVAGTYHNIHLTGYLLEKIGFEILNEILWHKTDATPNLSCTRFVADHENFLWARKDRGNIFNYEDMKKMNGGKQMRSIWAKGKTAGGKRIHPTQKPEWLLERIILSTSKKNGIVFDPFLGSGTTAVVAKKLNRKYLGTELDKDYFKLAELRIKNT